MTGKNYVPGNFFNSLLILKWCVA